MRGRLCLVCSCEDTMPLDGAALHRGAARQGAELRLADQLCRGQLDRYRAALAEGRSLTVACTQEAALFTQEAELAGAAVPSFVNVREHAGWSREADRSGPKMAALLAAAAIPAPATPLVPMTSAGVCLVLGRDEAAIAAARRLQDRLDLTVLLTGEAAVTPARDAPFPVLRGRARAATGWLGTFTVTIDGFAAPAPSSRAEYCWGAPRDGTTSRCDILLDLTGAPPLFPAADLRDGYLRADPADAAAVERAIATAGGLVGGFDKPRFVAYDAGLCAHGRNRRTGCTRCLDLCPTGAITAAGDHVSIAAEICAGCGACAAVCPTGAATYALPPPGTVLARAREMLLAFAAAGGTHPVLLLHDAAGEALIDALARHGDGLPARVLPLRLNETGVIDPSLPAAALAWGAAAVRVALPARRGHGSAGLLRTLDLLGAALAGLGLEGATPRCAAIETDDPFTLGEALSAIGDLQATGPAAEFLPLGAPREVALQAFRALAAPPAPQVVALPPLAPFGVAQVATAGCTLCLACTMVCPTGAFTANPERPELRFTESACVQCGLCVATCPERVITLEPRLDLRPEAAQPRVVKAEDPARCTRCDKAFGTRSSIDRVRARLVASGHWMFQDPRRLAALDLCEDCRAVAATEDRLDPYAGPARPIVKTTADWLHEAATARDAGDGSGFSSS